MALTSKLLSKKADEVLTNLALMPVYSSFYEISILFKYAASPIFFVLTSKESINEPLSPKIEG